MAISKYNCFYCNDISSNNYQFLTLNNIKELIGILLNETFVKIGDLIFKRIKDIPMGGAASPLIADLTLSVLEYKFMTPANIPSNVNHIKLIHILMIS